MKTAGDAILFQLKSLGEAQAETLARRLGISVQAVRQRESAGWLGKILK